MPAGTNPSCVCEDGLWGYGPAYQPFGRATRMKRRCYRCAVRVDDCRRLKIARDGPRRDANHRLGQGRSAKISGEASGHGGPSTNRVHEEAP
eukprot:4687537-Heterocapsa_arctica.AAC.1